MFPRYITNSQTEILNVTGDFSPSHEELVIKLTTIKNSLHEDFNKVKVLVLNYYDQILTLLNWEKTEVELEKSNYG